MSRIYPLRTSSRLNLLNLTQRLEVAFRGKIIDSLEHPIVLQLQGRV